MKKKIDISGVDPILFEGLNDQNLKVLENHFNSRIVVRGSNMNLEGKKEEIKHIVLVVQHMLTLINKKGSLSLNDLKEIILFHLLASIEIILFLYSPYRFV